MIRGVHLVDVQQDDVVAEDEMRQMPHVVDRAVVADVARDDQAVGDAGRRLQFVMFQHDVLQTPEPDQARKLAVLDQVRRERVGHEKAVPIAARHAVLHQRLDLRRAKMPPRVRRPPDLGIAQVILVHALGQVFLGNKLVAQRSGRKDSDFTHHVYSKYARLIDSRNSP